MIAELVLAVTMPNFAGVSLGDTPATVIAERGDPGEVRDDGRGRSHFTYLAPSGGGIQLVVFDDGVVSTVATIAAKVPTPVPMPAPSAAGITLGQAVPPGVDVSARHFSRLGEDGGQYEFGIDPTGMIRSIALEYAPGASTPAPHVTVMASPAMHGGTSFDDAIIVRADSDMAGTASEYFYLALHPCGEAGHWHRSHQSLVHQNGKSYDQLDVVCTVGTEKRSFFFDITNTFGKM